MAQITLQPTQSTQSKQFPNQFMILASVFVLTLVLLAGFAINMKPSFFANTNIQDATDIIAMNAASALCQGGDPETAALQALTLNPAMYSIDNVSITIANPPPAGTNYAGNSNYVYIELSGQKSNVFNQLMNIEPTNVAATAVTTCS